ncbi:MAG: hypothetical protein KDD34_07475 [Bdellovibrionales bacterium]|nr:hypothetical protein [Bdellovibrionales bacterium]
MFQKILLFILSCFFIACSSKPEVPQGQPLQRADIKPAISKNSQTKWFPNNQNRYGRFVVSSGLRFQEADCQIYSKPNFYSEKLNTAKGGKDIWTEDTGSAWYKVYRDKKYGYMSKICFNN